MPIVFLQILVVFYLIFHFNHPSLVVDLTALFSVEARLVQENATFLWRHLSNELLVSTQRKNHGWTRLVLWKNKNKTVIKTMTDNDEIVNDLSSFCHRFVLKHLVYLIED